MTILRERGKKLPIEFVALGYKPRPWTPADTYLISLYMYKTLTSTWKEKLNRQWITEKVGAERAREMFVSDSPLDHFIWTAGTSLRRAGALLGQSEAVDRIVGTRAVATMTSRRCFRLEWDAARRLFWRSLRRSRRKLSAATILW